MFKVDWNPYSKTIQSTPDEAHICEMIPATNYYPTRRVLLRSGFFVRIDGSFSSVRQPL